MSQGMSMSLARLIVIHLRIPPARAAAPSPAPGWDRLQRSDQAVAGRQEAWERAHRDFHLKLLEGCDMPLLLNHCNTLHDLNDRYRRMFLAKNPFDRDVNGEHAAIVAATKERNADLACALLAQHIQRTTQNICRSLVAQNLQTPG